MNRALARSIEIGSLVVMGLAIVVATVIISQRGGNAPDVAIGGLVAVLPLVIQAIRNTGQSQAMQSMVDHLARSQPSDTGETP